MQKLNKDFASENTVKKNDNKIFLKGTSSGFKRKLTFEGFSRKDMNEEKCQN